MALLQNVCQHDEASWQGAHSCGAVAEFHRLPEHPGELREWWCCRQGSNYAMEASSTI
jgi:hypothetical protein